MSIPERATPRAKDYYSFSDLAAIRSVGDPLIVNDSGAQRDQPVAITPNPADLTVGGQRPLYRLHWPTNASTIRQTPEVLRQQFRADLAKAAQLDALDKRAAGTLYGQRRLRELNEYCTQHLNDLTANEAYYRSDTSRRDDHAAQLLAELQQFTRQDLVFLTAASLFRYRGTTPASELQLPSSIADVVSPLDHHWLERLDTNTAKPIQFHLAKLNAMPAWHRLMQTHCAHPTVRSIATALGQIEPEVRWYFRSTDAAAQARATIDRFVNWHDDLRALNPTRFPSEPAQKDLIAAVGIVGVTCDDKLWALRDSRPLQATTRDRLHPCWLSFLDSLEAAHRSATEWMQRATAITASLESTQSRGLER